jgi:beta-barrel assembly-enhancing protease
MRPVPTKWPFSFHLVNVKEINAFALPGGPIYVNVGTIQAADSEGQLAGVIAHECSHVVLRHSTQQISKQMMAQLPLAVLGATIGQGSLGQLAQLGIGLGAQSLFLKYSRDAEREADLLGSQIMYDAGYDPYDMVEFFTKLEKQGGPGVPQFLSDHPNPGNRVENVRTAISKYPPKHYQKNSAEFEQVKAEVGQLHPVSSQELARQQPAPEPGQGQPQISGISLQDVMPGGQFRVFDHSAYRIEYPDNWRVFGDANSAVTIAPPAAVAQSAIAYGMIISGFRPESGRDSLDLATHDLLNSLAQANPGLRIIGHDEDIQLNGVPAKSVYLLGNSPLQGQNGPLRERDWLVTVQWRDNTVLFLVFSAPDRDFGQLAPTYEQMPRSFRLK